MAPEVTVNAFLKTTGLVAATEAYEASRSPFINNIAGLYEIAIAGVSFIIQST